LSHVIDGIDVVKGREASKGRLRPRGEGKQTPFRLAARERQIVDLLVEGCTNKEIASRLSVSDQTVKNRLTVLYRKTGVSGRVALAVFAVRSGLTSIAGTQPRASGN
jgi:DNA-binding NarL/FixJ family response regulator